MNTKRIYGPTPKEAAHAYFAAAAANEFLNAYLANKITPELVRTLAVTLEELIGECVGGGDWGGGGGVVLEVNFSGAQWDNNVQAGWVEDQPEEKTSA